MNIICDKTLLSAAIDGVSKAVTLRSTCLLYTSDAADD